MSELRNNADQTLDALMAAVGQVLGDGEKIALHEPEFAGNEWRYVKDCIDTGWVSSVGAYVDRFERDIAEYVGCKHAVATSNGTSALHVCLLVAGVQTNDEVLMPSLTFIATANAVTYANAIPHFADCESVSLGIDPVRLDAYLSEIAHVVDGQCFNKETGRRISALLVMHVFGHPSELDQLIDVAARWKIALIEDAAESLGSYYHGRHTGNFGVVSAMSFNGNKIITTGGGGAVLTNDPVMARRAKHLSTTARLSHAWNFLHDEIGFNYRMPNLNAALGCAQIEQLPMLLERKRALAVKYENALAGLNGISFLKERADTRSNYWLNTIMLDKSLVTDRDAFLARLNEAGYMSRPVWTLMHRLPMYRDCPKMDLSVAERLEGQLISLPSSAKLGD